MIPEPEKNKITSTCGYRNGQLSECGMLAVPYVPFQEDITKKYNQTEALNNGTLFPGLDLPFFKATSGRPVADNALTELMRLEFVIGELGLYLDTHPKDKEATALYSQFVALEKAARQRYVETVGPIVQTESVTEAGYTWVNNPWPWDPSEREVKPIVPV